MDKDIKVLVSKFGERLVRQVGEVTDPIDGTPYAILRAIPEGYDMVIAIDELELRDLPYAK